MEIREFTDPRKSKVKFILRPESNSFHYTLGKFNVQMEDPHLSQFHELPESQDDSLTNSQLLFRYKSMKDADALCTLYMLRNDLKEGYEMVKGVSSHLELNIKRVRIDEAGWEGEDEGNFEIKLKAKGESNMRCDFVVLPKGGPDGRSLIIRRNIEKNVKIFIPIILIGRILKLNFIQSSIKIDVHQNTVLRFIFKFKPIVAHGSLYYNIGQSQCEEYNGNVDEEMLADEDFDENDLQNRLSKQKLKKKHIPRQSFISVVDGEQSDSDE